MKHNNRFGYFIKEGVSSAVKNGVMSLASVSVLIACLLIVGSFYVLTQNIDKFLSDIESENEIAVFIDESLSLEEAQGLKDDIEALNNVRKTEFTSREQALEDYKAQYENGDELFAGLPDDTLRHSYRVFLDDISLMEETIEEIKGVPGVASVNGRLDISENLVKLKNILSSVMLGLFIVLLGISLFIISNTIKVAMFARRKEINIMKHVGATDWFIKWPFIIEGMAIGLLGSAIAFGLQMYVYVYVVEKVLNNIQIIHVLPFSYFMPMLPIAFASAGVLIGIISSWWSVRKYLYA